MEMQEIWGSVLPKQQLKRYLEDEQQEVEKRHKGIKMESPSQGRMPQI